MVAEKEMRETIVHGARVAADTLAGLSRGDVRDSGPKPDGKMKIVMLARRVAAVRKEMERRAARTVNE